MNRSKRTFYPICDWEKSMVLEAVRRSGISLPEEYKYGIRSMSNNIMGMHLRFLAEKFPADHDRLKLFFPLVDAVRAQAFFAAKGAYGETYLNKEVDPDWRRKREKKNAGAGGASPPMPPR